MADRDDFTPGMKEAPFYRDGMSVTEYDAEREHWLKHDTPQKMIIYTPLWKRENNENDVNSSGHEEMFIDHNSAKNMDNN